MWRGVAPLPIRVCGVVCCPVAVLACFVCRVCVCSVPTQIILIGFMSNIPCRRPPRERPTRPRRAGPGPNSSRHFTHSIQIHTQTQARRASSKLLFHTCGGGVRRARCELRNVRREPRIGRGAWRPDVAYFASDARCGWTQNILLVGGRMTRTTPGVYDCGERAGFEPRLTPRRPCPSR